MSIHSKMVRSVLLLTAALAIGGVTVSQACTLRTAKCAPPPNSGRTVKNTGGIGSGGIVGGGGGGGARCYDGAPGCHQPY
jgi:hypothetical protein